MHQFVTPLDLVQELQGHLEPVRWMLKVELGVIVLLLRQAMARCAALRAVKEHGCIRSLQNASEQRRGGEEVRR